MHPEIKVSFKTLFVMKNFYKAFVLVTITSILVAFAVYGPVTGKVTDDAGNPLSGVIVIAKGTFSRSVTDVSGNYRINVDKKTDALIFSLSGYKTLVEKISGRNVINVKMSREPANARNTAMPSSEAKLDKSSSTGYFGSDRNSMLRPYFRAYTGNFNTEGYATVNENGYKSVSNNPLSTFSIDVDNASYSNIRRFINSGTKPPPDAVRIEEMINYFKYSYPEPVGEHPFSVSTDIAVCPWNNSHMLFLIGLKGKSIDRRSLPPSNLVFLIDVSGSMNAPNKLPLLKSAFGLLVNELRPLDRVAIVVYAGAAGLVLESTPGNKKELIMSAIDNLEAGGSTAGGAGLKLAYSEAEKNFIKEGNNRIILATDGDFNVGESSNGGMERLIAEKRNLGIFITVLGFGMGNLKDDKMEIIADKGNGNYSYIDNLQEARRVLVGEFGATLFTIARDVKLQIEFNPVKISSYRLIGYENRILNDEDFNDDRKDAGEMGAGHMVTALYEIIPSGSEELIPSVDPLKYQAARNINVKDYGDELLTVKVRYKRPAGGASMLFEKAVIDADKNIDKSSENLRFAAAVAEFGMILRESEYKGTASLEGAADLAKSARGNDEDGYRSELIRLISTVKDMGGMADKR